MVRAVESDALTALRKMVTVADLLPTEFGSHSLRIGEHHTFSRSGRVSKGNKFRVGEMMSRVRKGIPRSFRPREGAVALTVDDLMLETLSFPLTLRSWHTEGVEGEMMVWNR